MLKVRIEDWVIDATHGMLPNEKERPQRFRLAIEVLVDAELPMTKISHSVDYRDIKKIVEEVMAANPEDFVETLAYSIAQRVLNIPRVQQVIVGISKLDIWSSAVPGICLTLP